MALGVEMHILETVEGDKSGGTSTHETFILHLPDSAPDKVSKFISLHLLRLLVYFVNVSIHISIECVSEPVVLKGHWECLYLVGRSHKKLFVGLRSELVNEFLKPFTVVVLWSGWYTD